MRLLLVYISMLIFLTADVFAQHTKNSEIQEHVADKGLYRFASFEEGQVVFRNGNVSAARLNYNISHDELHFIDQAGDTLAIKNIDSIQFVFLNGSRFYYDKGFLQTISIKDGLILAFKQILDVELQLQQGHSSSATSIQNHGTFNYFTGNGQQYKLSGRQFRVSATEIYFFGDENGNFINASKEFVLRHFKKNQEAIKSYIKKSHISFNSLEDLLKLLQYCEQLH